MADRYWLGVNADWNDTANWSTTLTGTGGSAAPVSTNDVYILKGSGDINVNVTGHDAVDLNSLTIGGEFTGSIGNAGTSLAIAVSGRTSINYKGSGVINITAGTSNIDDLHITRPSGAGSATVNLTGGLFTAVYVGRGVSLTIAEGATCTTLVSTGAAITVGYNSTAITTATIMGGGSFSCRRTVTTLNEDACTVTMLYVAAHTTLNLRNGARHTHDSTGTVSKVNAYPGSLFAAGGSAFTVTNADVYAGSSYLQGNTAAVTESNNPVEYP